MLEGAAAAGSAGRGADKGPNIVSRPDFLELAERMEATGAAQGRRRRVH